MTIRKRMIPVLWMLAVWAAAPLCAQIAGTQAQKSAGLRATAVLEWVGEAGKPSASRLVPVAIYDGTQYQDASIYLARPEPLALDSDTEYEIQQAGTPKGLFDVFSAGQLEGLWYGYGVWRRTPEAKLPHLEQSKIMPQVVREADADRPHFKNAPDKQEKPAATTEQKPASSPEPKPDNAPADTAKKSEAPAPAVDPDRPKLRKRSAVPENASPEQAAVTAEAAPDPDRPKLHRGKPQELREADKLTGFPPNLQQMVALSYTTNEEPHPYVYQWADPQDATKMQAALEKIAREALAAKYQPAVASPAPRSPRPARAKRPAPALVGPELEDEQFHAFELTYSGGVTAVFSARTAGEGAAMKYVTLIAQPDFYGNPRILFQSVTDGGHLDETPRMRLVDAADTDGDHRAELLFELRGKSERQFAIYRVVSGVARQVFVSASLP